MSVDISYSPRTGDTNGELPNTTDLDAILSRATRAARILATVSPSTRAAWIHAVAEALDAHADELAHLADSETALGMPRLTGEIARAASQLRFYASVAVEGSYLGAAIDRATESTPSLARVNIPLGPVAVFGASNFPFAFGVLGNDTGSALAAGCPVVVKAHPAHPLTSALIAEITVAALSQAGAPDGTFALVSGFQAGVDLVKADAVAAVAFTGSQTAGQRLWKLANERDIVIPVYAEMGTVNPVVVTRAAAASMTDIAKGFVGSFTLGFGQFCTKPGVLFAPASADAARVVADALAQAAPSAHMLTRAIADGVSAGIDELISAGAELVGTVPAPGEGWAAPAAVLSATVADLRSSPRLLAECFGPVVLVVDYHDDRELYEGLDLLPGALAAAVMASVPDDPQLVVLLDRLSAKVGRVTVNDWTTSVSWQWAQQHGGPWPATTDPRTTSVGAAALDRFVRPVTYQSVPPHLLPPALSQDNPWVSRNASTACAGRSRTRWGASSADGQPDLLEFLEIAIARLGHPSPQAANEVQRAERVVRRAGQHLTQRRPLAERHLKQSPARQRWMRRRGGPEPAFTQRLGRNGQRGAEHHRVRTARDGLGQVAGGVDVAVGQHVHIAPAGLVEVFAAGRRRVGDRGRHRHADAEDLVAGRHAGGRPVADDDACGAGTHQMQGRAVVEHTARDDRHVQLGDEGLEVQRLTVLRDALRRDDRALDDQQVDARGDQRRRQRLRVLRAHPHGRRHPGVADPRHSGTEQVGIQRRGVQLLQQPDRRRRLGFLLGGLDDLRDLLHDIGVPADQALAVEHTEPAEPAQLDGELGRDQRIGGMRHHGNLEPVGIHLPCRRHVL